MKIATPEKIVGPLRFHPLWGDILLSGFTMTHLIFYQPKKDGFEARPAKKVGSARTPIGVSGR